MPSDVLRPKEGRLSEDLGFFRIPAVGSTAWDDGEGSQPPLHFRCSRLSKLGKLPLHQGWIGVRLGSLNSVRSITQLGVGAAGSNGVGPDEGFREVLLLTMSCRASERVRS